MTVLPIWIVSCTQEQSSKPVSLENDEDFNLILQVLSGRCMVICNSERRGLLTRSVLFLGRMTRVELVPDADRACRYISQPSEMCSPRLIRT